MEEKKTIRRRMKELSRALPEIERTCAAHGIREEVEITEAFAAARTVALFCSLPDEPPTEAIIAAWSASKRVVLPRVEGDLMQFYPFEPSAMATGAFGISEPVAGAPCDPASIDLILVPGVAFTAAGSRLGRGRGYYDKYLSQPGFRAVKIGVCYTHQLVGELPCEPHDVLVDRVVAR